MGDLMFVTGIVLSVAWLVGYLGYNADGAIHLLLIGAFILLLLSHVTGNKSL